MAWLALGGVVVRLAATAVSLAESSKTSLKGGDKLGLALGMVQDLASNCQQLSPKDTQVLQNPQVQVAMKQFMEARVNLENAIARVASAS
jgi:hypothetical protein